MDSLVAENEWKNIEARSDEKFGRCLSKSCLLNLRLLRVRPTIKRKQKAVNVIARLIKRNE